MADAAPKPWEKGSKIDTTKMKPSDYDEWRGKWDIIITYKEFRDEELKDKEKKMKFKRAQLLRRMRKCGLVVAKQDTAGPDDFVMLKITAPYATFEKMAEHSKIQVNMPLKKENRTVVEARTDHVTKWNRFFTKYILHGKAFVLENSYSQYFPGNEGIFDVLDKRFFRSLDRQKFILYILEARRWQGGCDIDLSAAVHDHTFAQVYALHTKRGQQRMKENWIGVSKFQLDQPYEIIRDYFGEKVMYYFAFLAHYTRWLSYLSVFGMITFLVEWLADGDPTTLDLDHPIGIVYCFIICTWCSLFLEMWKRKQAMLGFMFNVNDFENESIARPEFKGEKFKGKITSAGLIRYDQIDGITQEQLDAIDEEVMWYSTFSRAAKQVAGIPIVTTFVTAVLIGTFWLLVLKTEAPEDEPGYSLAISIGNALFIVIMNVVYQKWAVILTNFENYRTDIEYEDALIAKTFIFQFVNSYISLFIIAFVMSSPIPDWSRTLADGTTKTTDAMLPEDFRSDAGNILGYSVGTCVQDSCMLDLFHQLLMILAVKQIVSNVQEALQPIIVKNVKRMYANYKIAKASATQMASKAGDLASFKSRESKSDMSGDGVEMSAPKRPSKRKTALNGQEVAVEIPFFEEQMHSPAFAGTFGEYNELMVQFGYMTLFASAFPLASVASLINNIIEIKLDAAKLVYEVQRPKYEGANSIGTWGSILTAMNVIAVMTNVAIVCFTSSALRGEYEDRTTDSYRTCVAACGDPGSTSSAEYQRMMAAPVADSWLISSNMTDLTAEAHECLSECQCSGPCLSMEFRFVVFVCIEHAIFLFKILLDRLIPDVPLRVEKAIMYKEFMEEKLEHQVNAAAKGASTEPEAWADDDSGDENEPYHDDPFE